MKRDDSKSSEQVDLNEDEVESVDLTIGDDEKNMMQGQDKGKNKRQRKSKWWQYFDILPCKQGEELRCKCKACGKTYWASSFNGTSNLKHHVTSQCPRMHSRDIVQTLIEFGEKGMSSRSQVFSQERFRELVVSAIIKHELPFQFVEYEAVRAIFAYLQPQATLFTRNTAKADVLKMHKREMTRLSQELRSCPSRICFTSDLWTSIATDGYICLTAHYIDSDWILQKRILNFSYMPPPHSGVALCEKIHSLLKCWGIDKKVFTMTLDNAAANDVFVDVLKTQLSLKVALVSGGEFLHVRCCAHILNPIVQEGLKKIDNSVDQIRECVKYVKGSQVRKQKFLECVAQTSLDSRKALRQDVPTRWNSTYLMLSSALYYRLAFNRLRLSDSNFVLCPTTDEWGRVEKICKYLHLFYETTNVFSGVKYPTANLYFPRVFMLQLTLNEEKESTDDFMKQIASQMYGKFDKYWKDYSVLLAIAVIFDPRYKIQFVEFCYNKLYGVGSQECLQVKEKLFSLFGEYLNNANKPITSASSSTSSSHDIFGDSALASQISNPNSMDVLKEFDTFESSEFICSAQKSQLELYLDEPRIDRNVKLDVLSFWKAHQFRYPELAQLAQDILSVPISTVASESSFSTGGRILDQFRSTLKPDVVEALVCCRDWMFGQTEFAQVKLDELTENVIDMSLNNTDAKSSTAVDSYNTIDVEFD